MTVETSTSERFRRAIALIDAANAGDPVTLKLKSGPAPKELTHAVMLTEWVKRLRPDAGEALLLAARAHHIRRWEVPRSTYPAGRQGYLRWRRDLHNFHANEAARILAEAGYEPETIERVKQLIHKRGLGRDPDAQALEDGLCLVFLETQYTDLTDQIDDEEKMIDVLRKTWRKMSAAGRSLALTLDYDEAGRRLLEKALARGTGDALEDGTQ
jgi:hypothetical protein